MPPQGNPNKKPVKCSTCTIRLVRICEKRAWWFGPARFPLVLGMRGMAKLHRVDPNDYDIRSEECLGCLRFLKLDLKARSPTFRFLNRVINPRFDRIRNSLLTDEELAEARRLAGDLYGDYKKPQG